MKGSGLEEVTIPAIGVGGRATVAVGRQYVSQWEVNLLDYRQIHLVGSPKGWHSAHGVSPYPVRSTYSIGVVLVPVACC